MGRPGWEQNKIMISIWGQCQGFIKVLGWEVDNQRPILIFLRNWWRCLKYFGLEFQWESICIFLPSSYFSTSSACFSFCLVCSGFRAVCLGQILTNPYVSERFFCSHKEGWVIWAKFPISLVSLCSVQRYRRERSRTLSGGDNGKVTFVCSKAHWLHWKQTHLVRILGSGCFNWFLEFWITSYFINKEGLKYLSYKNCELTAIITSNVGIHLGFSLLFFFSSYFLKM